MIQRQVRHFEPAQWPIRSASLIQKTILKFLATDQTCRVMLTGGRGAACLYAAWSSLENFQKISGAQFYFGDERCVLPDDVESNYGMVMKTLFQRGIPTGCSLFRMEAEAVDREAAAQCYENLLPAAIDVLLLSVGEDGHVASLFPNSSALKERKRSVVPIKGPKPPFDRLTITPTVIARARSIFVLATGEAKAAVLHSALNMSGDAAILPARMLLNATWLLDSALPVNNS